MDEPNQDQRLRSVGEIIDGCAKAIDRTADADWERARSEWSLCRSNWTLAIAGYFIAANFFLLDALIAAYLYLQFFAGGS